MTEERETGLRARLKHVHMLPTLMTLGNLLCGFGAVALALRAGWVYHVTGHERFEELMLYACYAIFGGMLFDMLDGRVARMTNSTSEFGKEIDSLADVVTFGIAPAAIVWQLSMSLSLLHDKIILGLLGLYVAFAALRLARYNVETHVAPPNLFFGLPSPAAAGAVISLVILQFDLRAAADSTFSRGLGDVLAAALPMITAVIGVLMITRIYYVHVPKRYLAGRHAFSHVVIVLLTGSLLSMFPQQMLALACCGYTIAGVIGEIQLRLRKPEAIKKRKELVRSATSGAAAPETRSDEERDKPTAEEAD